MAIKGLLERFKKGLARTAQLFNIRAWFGRKVDQSFLDDLEARLIQADVGVAATGRIIDRVRETYADKTADENLVAFVKDELKSLLEAPTPGAWPSRRGSPASTWLPGSTARARRPRSPSWRSGSRTRANRSCWVPATRSGRPPPTSLKSGPGARLRDRPGASGADPASVAHDACQRALARGIDVLIVDTAGRLHTQTHLMRELEKIKSVIQRLIPGAPHEVLLVLDGTNGQNAIRQAEVFTKSIGCTGVVLTKLDGTAKGGVVVAVRQTMKLPIKFIGVGEALDDLQPFDADTFVESLFA